MVRDQDTVQPNMDHFKTVMNYYRAIQRAFVTTSETRHLLIDYFLDVTSQTDSSCTKKKVKQVHQQRRESNSVMASTCTTISLYSCIPWRRLSLSIRGFGIWCWNPPMQPPWRRKLAFMRRFSSLETFGLHDVRRKLAFMRTFSRFETFALHDVRWSRLKYTGSLELFNLVKRFADNKVGETFS
jgi:hypothetical protein